MWQTIHTPPILMRVAPPPPPPIPLGSVDCTKVRSSHASLRRNLSLKHSVRQQPLYDVSSHLKSFSTDELVKEGSSQGLCGYDPFSVIVVLLRILRYRMAEHNEKLLAEVE